MIKWNLFLLLVLVESSPFCDGSNFCKCESSFSFKNSSCLTLCPTGYSSFNSSCNVTSSRRLATLNFYGYWDFSKSFLDSFSLIPNNFQSENNTLPVPTKDRGFFFKNSSEIRNSKSNIFSPDFTIRMTVKVTADGVIMKSETNGTENFKLFVNNSEICFSVLMSQVVDSANLKYSENMTRVLRGKFIENRGNYDDYRGIERVRDGEKEKLNIEKNQNWKKFKEDEDYENLIVKNKDGKKVRILGSLVEDLEFKENKKRILSNESFSNQNNSSQTNSSGSDTNQTLENNTNSSDNSTSSNSSDNSSENSTDSSGNSTSSNNSDNTTNSSNNSTSTNETISNSTTEIIWKILKFYNTKCVPVTLGDWYIFIINTNVSFQDYSITLRYNKRLGFSLNQVFSRSSILFPFLEFLEQSAFEVTTIGMSQGSFSGFLYQLILDNQILGSYEIYNDLVSCDFPYFYDYSNKVCEICNHTNQGILCTFKNGYCYSDDCSKCTGFSYNTCQQCSNNLPAPECGNTYFNQTNCSQVTYKSMCVYPTSVQINDTSLPAINIKFLSFDQFYGGIFQSGAKNETFGPFANPEIDDPIPAKGRGLYFNETQYLRSVDALSLNTDFSIGLWYRTEKNGVIWSTKNVKILNSKIIRMCLFNGFDDYCVMSSNATVTGNWDFVIYSVEFDEGLKTTRISRLESDKIYIEDQVQGYSYQNQPEIIYIGQDAYGNFKGFLYQVLVWNTNSFNYKSFLTSFCISGATGCVWQTSLPYYFNPVINKFLLCDSECEKGCNWWGTCNICNDSRCDTCEDYTTCSGNFNLNCSSDLKMSEDGKCCNIECKECFEKYFFSCKTCFYGFFLMGSVCAKDCPLGFEPVDGKCEQKIIKVMKVVFDTIKNCTVDSVNGIKFQSVQNFQNFSNSSVIPSNKRGVFFRSTSFITSEKFLMFYKFTVILYIKIVTPGIIMQKGLSSLEGFPSEINYFSNNNSFKFSAPMIGLWKKLTLTSESNLEGFFISRLYFNLISTLSSKALFINLDSNSSLILGDSFNSFTGFIYSLSIYHTTTNHLTLEPIPSICSDSNQLSCLSDCSFQYFGSGLSCLPCPDCENGCHSENFCNLCNSDHCSSCETVAGECLNCIEGYVLKNKTCLCKSQEYMNLTGNCEKCDFNCKECLNNSTFCIECGNFSVIDNSTCRCIESFIENLDAKDYFQCICPNNSELVKGKCVCREGFTRIGPSCLVCDLSCLTCKGLTYADCLTCDGVLDFGICLNNCALGYDSVQGVCVKREGFEKVFDLTFNYKELPGNDSSSGVVVEYKSRLSRQLQSEPSSVLFRGIYLNGVSDCFEFPSPPLATPILNYNFSISLWLYPVQVDGSLISQSFLNEFSFALTIQNTFLVLDCPFTSTSSKLTSKSPIKINEWSNIIISIFFQGSTTGRLVLNQQQPSQVFLKDLPFIEKIGSIFTFGEGLSENFKGFLYSLTIFNIIPEFKQVSSGIVFCGQDTSNENCLSLCPFDQFYDESDKTCYDCLKKCEDGCRNNVTCSQCQDPYCLICNDFFGECQICSDFYQLVNGKCFSCEDDFMFFNQSCIPCPQGTYGKKGKCYECPPGMFYDSKTCSKCPDLCIFCKTYKTCITCIENSFLNESYQCECASGYDINNFCLKSTTYFHAIVSVSFDNEISLQFSEELSSPLLISSIQLNSKNLNFSINKLSTNLFILSVTYPETISENSKLEISFNKNLSSVKNSSISPEIITVNLFPTAKDPLSTLIKNARDLATTGVTAGLSISLGSSFLSFDPTSFFSFISTAETFYPISLFSCDLPADLKIFLASIRVQKTLPNFFELFLSEKDGKAIDQKLKDLGFNSSLILMNTGVNLSIGIVFLVVMIFLKVLSKVEKIKPLVKNMKKRFEYGIFIRFWVQSYLELFLGAFVTLGFTGFSNSIRSFDWFVGLVVMVRFKQIINFLGIFLLFFLIFRRKGVAEDGLERFFIAYGVIFDEFKSEGISSWIFYLLFVLRRLVVIIFALFIKEGVVQLMAIVSFSVCVLFYVAFTRCFKNFLSNFYVVVNEIIYLVSAGFILRHLIKKPDDSFKHVSRCVTAAWALNIFYGISLFVQTFFRRFFKKKAAKVANLEEITSVEKIGGNSGFFRDIINPHNSVKDEKGSF